MADPICRWRNPYVNTIVELVKALPHQEMPSDDFRTIIEERWPGFLHTPYQLACQMGLYYESEDGMYYPRFNHDIDENEARSYMERWIARYYVPNPYTKSMKTLQQPQPFLASIIRYVYNHPNETGLHSILEAVFQEKIGNIDIISNVLNTYTNLIKVDTLGNVELTDKAFDFMKQYIDRNDKKAFFENFSESNNAAKNLIFYGAPGTGKSNTIKCEVDEKGKSCIRTTFHPDSDYSTFVGCYKPTTKRVPMYTTYGEKAVPVKDENGEQIMEDRIIYEYVGQAFFQAYTEAWKKYAAVTEGKPAEQYLIVEEINRGNCAQIFGDLFQLLDRNDSGFSVYPIKADADLKKQLAKVFAGLNIAKKDSINALYKNEKDVVSQVLSGDILLLPNNLYIWATMNTSDQSLFPIDSAFKRRWDWEYVPIANANKNWKIEVNGLHYDWWEFLVGINKEIEKATSSEDKKLGYFFCKAKDDKGIIDAKTFVSKVIFYLWNDVFKDFADESATLFKATDGGSLSFNDFYRTEGNTTTANEDAIKQFLNNLGINEVSVEEMTDDEEDIDENGNPNSRDQSKYTINGDGKFKKSPLAREIVSRYLNSHPATSVEEALSIFNPIRTANFSYVESEFEYSQETPDSQTKRFWKVEWGDGKVIYVTKRWSLESITPVIDFVNNSDWGMTIAKVE